MLMGALTGFFFGLSLLAAGLGVAWLTVTIQERRGEKLAVAFFLAFYLLTFALAGALSAP